MTDLEPVLWYAADGSCGDCYDPYTLSLVNDTVIIGLFPQCHFEHESYCNLVIIRVLNNGGGGLRVPDPVCVPQ